MNRDNHDPSQSPRRKFLGALASMAFLSMGVDKASAGLGPPEPSACGEMPVHGTVAAKDHDCGYTTTIGGDTFYAKDLDCNKPKNNYGGKHADNSCGLRGLMGATNTDDDCTTTGTDNACGVAVFVGSTLGAEDADCPESGSDSDCGVSAGSQGGGYEDHDCSSTSMDNDCGIGTAGTPSVSHGDNDCGIGGTDHDCGTAGAGGVGHADSDCQTVTGSSDLDCGMASATGDINQDADCGTASPISGLGVAPDQDCSRSVVSGDQDCTASGRDSTCTNASTDNELGPKNPVPPGNPYNPPPAV